MLDSLGFGIPRFMTRNPIMPLAYGYIRYSSDQQEQGDSVRRQREEILAWVKRNKDRVQLDTSLGDHGFYNDQGKTGFALTGQQRLNLDDYALGEFMKLCESGRIQPGSYLLVESADRLSRESSVIALNLFTRLLILGVVVVTLTPEMEYRTDADIGKLITVGVTIDRAHDESRVKNNRGKNAWVAKRAGATVQPLTSLIPGWCRLVGAKKVGNRLVGGEIREDIPKANIVKRLFAMAQTGIGCRQIAKQLNADGTPVVGRAKVWTECGVYHILTSPAVIGEFRPHTGRTGNRKKGRAETRKPTGEVISNYYPVIIERGEFFAVQAGLEQRSTFRGRRGAHLNLFAGLLRDANDGGTFSYRHAAGRPATLIPVRAKSGSGGEWSSFPAGVLELAILSKLVELKASDVLPETDQGGEVVRLGSLCAAKESELREFRREIDEDPRLLKTLKETIIRLETEREQLAAQLAEAQREVASPLGEAWGQFRGVAELIAEDTSEELRLRCRTALRRLVESITCLFLL
jgi:DNA invertase Pin-like site-specific DNA recombinase